MRGGESGRDGNRGRDLAGGLAFAAAVAGVVVAEQFLGGQPVLEIAAGDPAAFVPEEVGGVLDFRFGGFGEVRGGFGFHGAS